MTPDTIELTRGRTGGPVLRPGQYAAVGCCRMTKALNQGDLFPACPAHGRSTEWERVPPGAVAGTAGGASRALPDELVLAERRAGGRLLRLERAD